MVRWHTWAMMGCLSCVLVCGCVKPVPEAKAPKAIALAGSDKRFSFLHAPSAMEALSRKLISAMDSGDAKTLLSLSDPEERRQLQLTEASVQALLTLYLAERSKIRSLGVTDCRPTREGCMCVETLRGANTDISIESMVFGTPSNPHAFVTQTLIRAIDRLRSEKQKAVATRTEEAAYRLSFDRWLQHELQPKGIPGFIFISFDDGKIRTISWDTLVRRAEDRLRDPGGPGLPVHYQQGSQ